VLKKIVSPLLGRPLTLRHANMRLRVFAERAARAVTDPNCANLPLPESMLGQPRIFTIRFRP
jgi:hypothetical protein